MDSSPGQMADPISEISKMDRGLDLECLPSQTVEFIKECGKLESSTARENSSTHPAKAGEANGNSASESLGFQKIPKPPKTQTIHPSGKVFLCKTTTELPTLGARLFNQFALNI